MNRITKYLLIEIRVLLRLWPFLLLPLLTFAGVGFWLLEAGILLALGLALLAAVSVWLFCLFVGMAFG